MPPGSFVSRARHLRIDPDEIRRGLNKGCRFQKTKKTGEGLSPLPRYDRDELRALYSLPPATQARVLVLKTDSRVLLGAPRNRFSTAQNVLCLWVEAASQESGGSRLVVDQEGAGQCDGARAGHVERCIEYPAAASTPSARVILGRSTDDRARGRTCYPRAPGSGADKPGLALKLEVGRGGGHARADDGGVKPEAVVAHVEQPLDEFRGVGQRELATGGA